LVFLCTFVPNNGYKDWFIQDYKKPGYTIEVGKGINPLPIEQFNKIYDDNEELLLISSII
jgi:g-D-glutamyl-meso-diaminopimelate peptidase